MSDNADDHLVDYRKAPPLVKVIVTPPRKLGQVRRELKRTQAWRLATKFVAVLCVVAMIAHVSIWEVIGMIFLAGLEFMYLRRRVHKLQVELNMQEWAWAYRARSAEHVTDVFGDTEGP